MAEFRFKKLTRQEGFVLQEGTILISLCVVETCMQVQDASCVAINLSDVFLPLLLMGFCKTLKTTPKRGAHN